MNESRKIVAGEHKVVLYRR